MSPRSRMFRFAARVARFPVGSPWLEAFPPDCPCLDFALARLRFAPEAPVCCLLAMIPLILLRSRVVTNSERMYLANGVPGIAQQTGRPFSLRWSHALRSPAAGRDSARPAGHGTT